MERLGVAARPPNTHGQAVPLSACGDRAVIQTPTRVWSPEPGYLPLPPPVFMNFRMLWKISVWIFFFNSSRKIRIVFSASGGC